jgi:hypothetical protein
MIMVPDSSSSRRSAPVDKIKELPAATAKILGAVRDAFHEGLAAHREYERLTSSGMRHDPALRASLSIRRVETAPVRNRCGAHGLQNVLCTRKGSRESQEPVSRLVPRSPH